MNKFEEFEKDMGTAVGEILPGAKCVKITVTFVDDDGARCDLALTREGFEDPDDVAEEDSL